MKDEKIPYLLSILALIALVLILALMPSNATAVEHRGPTAVLLADDAPPVDAVAPAEELEKIVDPAPAPDVAAVTEGPADEGAFEKVMAFLNSPVGILVVTALLGWIAKVLYIKKPKWKQYVDKYGPVVLKGIKMAEKKIPDDVESKATRRLDYALQYVLLITGETDRKAMEDAITAVHADAEKSGNI